MTKNFNNLISEKDIKKFLAPDLVKYLKIKQNFIYKIFNLFDITTFLHNIYYNTLSRRDIYEKYLVYKHLFSVNFYNDDARKTILTLDKKYDYILFLLSERPNKDMTDEEFTRYKSKTKALAQAMSAEKPDEEEISRLRTERSLIVKKSTSKIDLLKELVESDNFDFKNSVVYCGQGKDGEDSIIDTVTKILAENDKYVVSQYTSKTEDRIRVLYDFENGYFDTLIAIKCFDEGVDVPKLDKIYIMASDALRRQTVQRRGRVLRQCKETNKEIAYIFDMMVLPPLGILDGMGVESLLRNEIIRVQEYASLCTNKNIYKDIQDILGEYGFEMEELLNGEDRYN